jgi:hypothetical protein
MRIHGDAVVDLSPAASASAVAGVMPTPTITKSTSSSVPSVSTAPVDMASPVSRSAHAFAEVDAMARCSARK